MKKPFATLLGGLLILDFVIVLVMLFTDKNLQTDFGGASAYYSHWYGLLALGLLTLILGIGVLVLGARVDSDGRPTTLGRWAVQGGAALSFVAIAAMVGILSTYSQVGFPSANEFAKYLFGVSAYPGGLSYIPWLYDLLLALYVVSAAVGIAAILKGRTPAPPSSST